MWAEKLLDGTHSQMVMMMAVAVMVMTPQPSLTSGACLPVTGSRAAQPHHRRLYNTHTPGQGWAHCNVFVWPCGSSARNQTWGINRRREAGAEPISLRRLTFQRDGAARGRRWATSAAVAVYLKKQGGGNEKRSGSSAAAWTATDAKETALRRGGVRFPGSPAESSHPCCLGHPDLPSHSECFYWPGWETSDGGLFPLWLVHVEFRDVYDAGSGTLEASSRRTRRVINPVCGVESFTSPAESVSRVNSLVSRISHTAARLSLSCSPRLRPAVGNHLFLPLRLI